LSELWRRQAADERERKRVEDYWRDEERMREGDVREE
jgi:hypothetical protein